MGNGSLLALAVAAAPILGNQTVSAVPKQAHPAQLQAAPADRVWWQTARFGMFIHWGPVSLTGQEISWSRGGKRRGRTGHGPTPVEVYDNLYKKFNPIAFNADEWCKIAQDAGMKYLVFTTKHHDGFCMFDSEYTDYKITSPESPFRRDITRELADACHRAGLRFGMYYSPPDWHHPDYRTEHHARYVQYLHNQIRELLTKYGQVDVLWFDGLGGTAKDWDSENLFRMIRTLQPRILVNNRGGLSGDFGTPEQRIGGFDREHPWESCITICRQWSWKPNDRMKSLNECVHTLVRTAGGDGNLLFNVGPMPDGRIEPRQVKRLQEIGEWLGKYGESIYGTRGGPLYSVEWGCTTCKGKRVYLHVLDGKPHALAWPEFPVRIVGSRMLTPGHGSVEQVDGEPRITVDPTPQTGPDTILELELDKNAVALKPRAIPSGSLAVGKPAQASNAFHGMAAYTPDKAFDDDPRTRWATDGGTHTAWIAVDLGVARKIGGVGIKEACGERVRRFAVEARTDNAEDWKEVFHGTKVGSGFKQAFPPVTARFVRLHIIEASEGPTLWEVQVFPPEQR